jgi:hypothetical protein
LKLCPNWKLDKDSSHTTFETVVVVSKETHERFFFVNSFFEMFIIGTMVALGIWVTSTLGCVLCLDWHVTSGLLITSFGIALSGLVMKVAVPLRFDFEFVLPALPYYNGFTLSPPNPIVFLVMACVFVLIQVWILGLIAFVQTAGLIVSEISDWMYPTRIEIVVQE